MNLTEASSIPSLCLATKNAGMEYLRCIASLRLELERHRLLCLMACNFNPQDLGVQCLNHLILDLGAEINRISRSTQVSEALRFAPPDDDEQTTSDSPEREDEDV